MGSSVRNTLARHGIRYYGAVPEKCVVRDFSPHRFNTIGYLDALFTWIAETFRATVVPGGLSDETLIIFRLRLYHVMHVITSIKILPNEKSYPWKTIFSLMAFGAETIDLRSNLIKNVAASWIEFPNVVLGLFLALTLLQILANACKKMLFSQSLTVWWPLVTSIMT